jgi:signal transduction histidine kinase/putative methionine-R-sulfoxide reductase with GAF domain
LDKVKAHISMDETSVPPSSALTENDRDSPLAFDLLTRLNQIGEMIKEADPRDAKSVSALLQLIADSAAGMLPGSAVIIYSFEGKGDGRTSVGSPNIDTTPVGTTLVPSSLRVLSNASSLNLSRDKPRPDGMGVRALNQNRRVLSYEEADLPIHPEMALAGVKTVACFPLKAAGQTVGIIYVLLTEQRYLSWLELLSLENFANQAAMAIYQTRQVVLIQDSLARKEEELLHLRRAGLLISSRPRLEETLEAILQMAMEVTHARYGIFRLVDKSGQNLITRAIAGDHLAQPLVDALPVNTNSIMSWVARQRQIALIHDLREKPWVELYYPLDADLEMRSELAVPLIGASGRLEGVLNLESPLVGAFNETDSHLLQALATQAVVAIQEARLLDALQEVARLLLTKPSNEVLDHLADLACQLLNTSASVIWKRRGMMLVLTNASSGYPDTRIERDEPLPLQGSLAGQAVLTRQPVFSDDVRIDLRFHRPDLAASCGWKQALVVPLISSDQGEPIGAFSAYREEADSGQWLLHAESEWDVKVLTCLAHYAALAVQNADHQERLKAIQERNAVAEMFAAIGDIAANLLHNLNNKVGIIPVRVQGIQDKCQDALRADPYLETSLAEIERSAAQAMEFVRQNLSHLRPIRMAPLSIEQCVKQAVQEVNLPDSIRCEMDGLGQLPLIIAGERSLVLVFANLLENASSAMNGRGTIRVWGDDFPGWLEVNVRDNGPGISFELQDQIFELNYSGNPKTTPGKLGFGLWWVKTVITRLGGSVTVESDGVSGTTFRLRLPKKEPDHV